MRRFRRTLILAFTVFAAARVQAAAPAGAVAGTVVDQTGGGLSGVTVTLRDEGRTQSLEAVTGAGGTYRFPTVEPGAYEVAFTLIDFATTRRTGIDVQPGRTATADAVLHLSLNAQVTVTGRRSFRNLAEVEDPGASLVGIAEAASQGAVTAEQLEARPIMRAGEVVESVPGLLVSQHSGEGKANQFYLRGFNLDHGTDFAATVAGVPMNLPTHAHGQGYTDLNLLIPELVSGVQFRKGPYFAEDGDFSAAGAIHVNYANALDGPIVAVSGGGHGWARALAAVSPRVGAGHLLAAVEVNRNDGPWERGDDYRRTNGILRYTHGDSQNSFSLTGMSYQANWNATDQVPQRAILDGRLPRFGAIDLSNGGDTYRHSVALDLQRSRSRSLTRATGFVAGYGVNLFSNFTYFLDNLEHGDQFEQEDRRIIGGVRASHAWQTRWGTRPVEHRTGVQLRNDHIGTVGLHATAARARLTSVREDRVVQTSAGLWGQTEVQWASWVRTTTGVRADGYRFRVDAGRPENGGREAAGLVSPKFGAVLGPWRKTEWYVNAGYGFHSNDARGATIVVDPRTGEAADRVTPLVRARGAEIGLRSVLLPRVQTTVALWRLGLDSELLFVGDAGTTEPGRPSHRHGVEWSTYTSLRPWLALDADLAWSRARFRDDDPAGREISGAVARVASVGVSIDRDRRLFGTLRWRHLGPRPLVEDGSVRSRATSLVNAAAGTRLSKRLALVVESFNLFNSRASDIDYFYTSRLPGEPLDGVDDVHTHPAVPRTVRVALRVAY
ncbi:MAG: TonB-dependent receptor [Vicinamibacterales bacterium]